MPDDLTPGWLKPTAAPMDLAHTPPVKAPDNSALAQLDDEEKFFGNAAMAAGIEESDESYEASQALQAMRACQGPNR